MHEQDPQALQQFKNQVGIKFQLYNGLFTSLPFHRIEKTGILLSMLLSVCEEGFQKKLSPVQIIEDFFAKQTSVKTLPEMLDVLFRFIQYAERQVVLFDALEDAAFTSVHDMTGTGTLKHLLAEVENSGKEKELEKKLKYFCVYLVLTAHPTQFYPGPVLGIINDTTRAVIENNVANINMYLQQLGKTPFLKKQKPTPYDEAVSLIWYLENVFYHAAGKIISQIAAAFPGLLSDKNPVIKMGFWPGGDRDGNPFVTAETTAKVADALRGSIIKCYYLDVRRMRRRLTFDGVEQMLADLEKKLYDNIFIPGQRTSISKDEILEVLVKIRTQLVKDHNGLFMHLVNNMISKVHVFGLHFATLDIRQEAGVHSKVLEAIAIKENILAQNYEVLNDIKKGEALAQIQAPAIIENYVGIVKDTLQTIASIKTIQQFNGVEGCNRYIISQCQAALNVMEVYALFLLSGWNKEDLNIDIIPLFETIEDLKNAAGIMKTLYNNETYRQHLQLRNCQQTIMLGFSDGTKDGGYLMANWSIYKAKEELTKVSKENNIDVIFFDGRGGPPARGGGKTHSFYASMGKNIANKEIQLTVQGQTVSSSFGTADAAKFNIEQLLSAGISNDIFSPQQITLQPQQEMLLKELANASLEKYLALKDHHNFMQYLNEVSPLQFYSETNIGSRPAKRGSGKLTLKDLRAIPYVGAWSQLKQNVTGYYGVGTALQKLDKAGKFTAVKDLYKESLFFKTLMDNSEMTMNKCFFPLTSHLANHEIFGEIWQLIYTEFELTKSYIFKLSGRNELMSNYPVDQLSIQMRERIVLPLSTIQQYAISKIAAMQGAKDSEKEVYRKLIIRSSFGIINAARNAV
ncbi:MAG: phosphoenolpyruvate carboxylase [Ferruginibacter sp.]